MPRSFVRFALVLLVLAAARTEAQEVPADSVVVTDSTATVSTAVDSTVVDSLVDPARIDTVRASAPSWPVAPAAEGGLEQPVTYTARDSLRVVLAPRDTLGGEAPDDRAFLYGDVKAQVGEAEMTAARLELRFAAQELRALPVESDSGLVGVPRFAEGEESFTGREVVYNLRTQRGRVVGARTEIEDGYLIGGVIKQQSAHVIYAADAGYTTCSLDHPHYALTAGRMKIVDGERIYTGPVQLQLLGIPMPLWLPFGYFPAAEGRRSGPLPISYGEDRDAFGFYLENLGWYWALSDYVDALVSGKLGTRGSFQLQSRFNYVRRYAYDGALDLSYARLRRGEPLDLDPPFRLAHDVGVRWRHAQTFDPTASLNASVDLRSSISPLLAEDYETRVSQTSNSTVSLRKSWPRGGRALNLDLRAVQQLSTGGADLTLPSLSFSQQRRFPFRGPRRAGRDEAWFEKIGVSYSGTLTNTYRFEPLADSLVADEFADVSWVQGLFDHDAYVGRTGRAERFRPEARHQIPVSAAFSMERILGVPFQLSWSPSVTYTENWYARSERRALVDSTVQTMQEPGFTAIRRVNLGLSANTEFYGIFPFRLGPLNGLRHVVSPQVTFSYEPDYSAAPFDYFRTVTEANGTEVEYPVIAGIPNRRTQRLGFSLGNVVQTRVVRVDSTGEEQRRTIQLFSLNARTAYDFAAEERPFGDVGLDFTSQSERFRLQINTTLSPYALDSLGAITPTSYVEETGRLLRVTRVGVSAGTSFRAGGTNRPTGLPPGTGAFRNLGYDPTRPDYGLVPSGYVDFAVPWSLGLDFTYGYTPARTPGAEAEQNAVLSVSQFDVSLTPNWKIAGSTGFDLMQREIATTQLSIVRDLHCWEMRFNWTPFGIYRSFSFSIYVKSGHLRDLLRLDVPRSAAGNRLGDVF